LLAALPYVFLTSGTVVTAVTLKTATYVTARQKSWFESIQDRINFTTHILGSVKSVKMLGLTEKFETMIQALRDTELEVSKRFRRLSSFNICLGNIILTFRKV